MEMGEDPFVAYNISSKWKLLANVTERVLCPKCSRSRKFFCYRCYIPMPKVEDIVPRIEVSKL